MRPNPMLAALRHGACTLLLNWPAVAAVAGCLPDAQTLWIAPRTDGLVFDTPHEACARADFTTWCGPPTGGGPLGGWSSWHCAYGCNPPEHCPYDPGWLRVRQAGQVCPDDERWDGEAQRCTPMPTPDTGRPRCGLARGNPVHVGSGNKFESERDFGHRHSPLLAVERYYNSQLGRWRFSFEQALAVTWRWSDAAGYQQTVVLQRADGRGLDCVREPLSGRFICAADRSFRVGPVSDSGDGAAWQVSTPGGAREWYSVDGRQLRARDASGAELLLDYDLTPAGGGDGDDRTVDRLRDRWGNMLSVIHSPDGVSALITSDGHRYHYQRRADGLLIAVRYPALPGAAPAEKQYLYEDPRWPAALTGIINELGERTTTWSYDDRGRVISSARAGEAARHAFTYHADGTTTVTEYLYEGGSEPINAVTTYRFAKMDGVIRMAGIDGDHCAACGARREVTYDDNGFPATVTAPGGTVTEFTFDAEGHELVRLEAAGTDVARRTVTTWDPVLRRPLTRDVYDAAAAEPRHVLHSSYVYADQRLVSKTERDPESGTTRTTGYAYFPADHGYAPGRLSEIDGPVADDEQRFEYDINGNPSASINPLGHGLEYEHYDSAGRPGLIRDANGVETAITWHPRGWLLGVRTGASETRYTNDPAGRLTAITNALGGTTRYTYDQAGRLVGIETPGGERMTRVLDGSGNVMRLTLADGDGVVRYARDYAYDAANRLIGTIGGAGQRWHYSHDATGRVISIAGPRRDAAGQPLHVTGLRYDARGRVIEQRPPGGGGIRIAWDTLDRLASVQDGRGLSTRYDFDALGALRQLDSPDTGVSVFHHDAAGVLVARIDARGRIQVSGRDALGRLTSLRSSFDAPQDFIYDNAAPGCHGTGRLTAAGDRNGTVSFCYDAGGRVTEIAPAGLPADRPIAYQRDAAGFVTAITYPSGLVARYSRDTAGRALAVALELPTGGAPLTQPLLSDVRYAPFGPATQWTLHYAGGVAYQAAIELDGDYRVIATHAGSATATYFSYDPTDNVISRSGATGTEVFTLDGASRLVEEETSPGHRTRYEYDNNGNLTLRERRAGDFVRSIEFAVAAGSNRILSESSGLTGQSYLDYDASGNQTRRFSPVRDSDTTFAYSDANRLVSLRRRVGPFEVESEASYNPLGQRTALSIRYAPPFDAYDRNKRFAYDIDGQLLSEQQDGEWRYDYVYLGVMPVAFVFYPSSGPARVYHFHTDNLGTPRAATAVADGALAWRIRADAGDAFRLVAASPGNVAPGLRFPGQYDDPETGYVYNYFRDYAPDMGRYLQSDPIGLAGGLNTYAYVGGNPLRYFDRYGLETYRCRRPLEGLPFHRTQRNFADLPGNPFFHQYSCIVDEDETPLCAGHGPLEERLFGPGAPTDPGLDVFDPSRCELTRDDNDCFEECLRKEWGKPRPRYGIAGPNTNCQEWDRQVNRFCALQCGKSGNRGTRPLPGVGDLP